jgi:hypothetical protein
LVPIEDAEALARGICEVLLDPTLSGELASQGPVRARQFEASGIAASYAEFLDTFSS